MKRKEYRKKLIKQKLLGLVFIAVSIVVILVALNGTTVEEMDITPVLLFLPMGLGLVFSKRIMIY